MNCEKCGGLVVPDGKHDDGTYEARCIQCGRRYYGTAARDAAEDIVRLARMEETNVRTARKSKRFTDAFGRAEDAAGIAPSLLKFEIGRDLDTWLAFVAVWQAQYGGYEMDEVQARRERAGGVTVYLRPVKTQEEGV